MSTKKELSVPQDPYVHAVVMSSRVRFARNIRGFSFPGWLRRGERENLLTTLMPAIQSIPEMQGAQVISSMETFSPLDKQILVERHLISREHAAKNVGSGLVINSEQSLSFMVNEEDHLRLQSIHHGFQIYHAWNLLDKVDSELEDKVTYAFSPTLGYLTACPTNLGTGMRASVMLHLPGLVLSSQISQVIKSVNQIGLAVRGLYGEGTEALGNLFQISNQTTLGESEQQIVERIGKVILQLVEHEKNARLKLLQEKGRMLKDRFGRAFGNMKYSYSISSKEALNLLSLLRLAVDLELLPEIYRSKVDELLICTQPAHLQKSANRKLGAEERDGYRADYLRKKFEKFPEPDLSKID